MAERTYLSIGDVLSLLKGEFPDITISKIRFLESQGLLDPERTPSGYRKFYEEDVDRLRWILRQQRENFLPLKVIKGRLGGNGGNGGNGGTSAQHATDTGGSVGAARTATAASTGGRGDAARPDAPEQAGLAPSVAGRAGAGRKETDEERVAAEPAAREPTARTSPPASTQPAASTARSPLGVASPSRAGRSGRAESSPAEARSPGGHAVRPTPPSTGPTSRAEDTAGPSRRAEDAAGPRGRPEAGAARPGEAEAPRSASDRDAAEEAEGPLSIGLSGVNLTAEELAGASGLSVEELGELERYGLLVGRPVGDTIYYDEESLTVARLAGGFRRFGIEARHLRMYRTAADREAAFFEQIVMPLLKQRNPVARRRAVDTLAELARLGQGLRGSLLRSALKDNTGG